MRPDLGRDSPVAQSSAIITARSEPAIVEDVPLDTDSGRLLGKIGKTVQVLIEIDRFPDIEGYRASWRDGSLERAGSDGSDGLLHRGHGRASHRSMGWCRSGQAAESPHRQQQFPAADHLCAGEEALRIVCGSAPPVCTAQISPSEKENPGTPTCSSVAASGPVRPLRPLADARQRPVVGVVVPALAPVAGEIQDLLRMLGIGNAITQSLTVYGSSPVLISSARALMSPPTSARCSWTATAEQSRRPRRPQRQLRPN